MNYAGAVRSALVCVLLLSLPGCYFLGKKQRLVRIWADYNTLRAPAVYMEGMSHLPYPPVRVAREHMLYNWSPRAAYSFPQEVDVTIQAAPMPSAPMAPREPVMAPPPSLPATPPSAGSPPSPPKFELIIPPPRTGDQK